MEIIIKKGEGYLRRQSECSKKERRMDCDGGAAEDGELKMLDCDERVYGELKMRDCDERVASLVQDFDY